MSKRSSDRQRVSTDFVIASSHRLIECREPEIKSIVPEGVDADFAGQSIASVRVQLLADTAWNVGIKVRLG